MTYNSKKLIYGVGTKGYAVSRMNGELTKAYSTWKHMLERCYCPKRLSSRPTYIGCSVCSEWLSFPVFQKWFDSHYVEGYHLDKDLLVTGNKEYGPSTCVFVPPAINSLFLDSGKARGNYPIGVYLHKQSGKFHAKLKIDGKVKSLGYFNNPEDAHRTYLIAKKENAIRMADKWMDKIPTKLYDALIKKAENMLVE